MPRCGYLSFGLSSQSLLHQSGLRLTCRHALAVERQSLSLSSSVSVSISVSASASVSIASPVSAITPGPASIATELASSLLASAPVSALPRDVLLSNSRARRTRGQDLGAVNPDPVKCGVRKPVRKPVDIFPNLAHQLP